MNQHGDFIWYEYMAANPDAAAEFYGRVIGWSCQSADMPGMDYRFFSSGDGSDPRDGVGGMMAITPDMAAHGSRPAWVGYIAVDDVDASAAAMAAAGGATFMPPTDLPGVGRMAMLADPQGAPFYVMKGASDDESFSFAATEPKVGHGAWNELAASDPAAAKAFYSAHFGWVQDGDMDMGPMGKYEFLWASDKRFMQGAVMRAMKGEPSHWLFYFRVADIDAAHAALLAAGGSIFQEPQEIPGGDFSLIAQDPDGAHFGLVGARQ